MAKSSTLGKIWPIRLAERTLPIRGETEVRILYGLLTITKTITWVWTNSLEVMCYKNFLIPSMNKNYSKTWRVRLADNLSFVVVLRELETTSKWSKVKDHHFTVVTEVRILYTLLNDNRNLYKRKSWRYKFLSE